MRKSGAWYTYDGDQLGQGKENARNFLLQNPAMANEIESKILSKLGIGALGKSAASAAKAAAAEAAESAATKSGKAGAAANAASAEPAPLAKVANA